MPTDYTFWLGPEGRWLIDAIEDDGVVDGPLGKIRVGKPVFMGFTVEEALDIGGCFMSFEH